MIRLMFRQLSAEALAALEPFAPFCNKPLKQVDRGGIVYIKLPNPRVAAEIWQFVRTWGSREQLQRLRTYLQDAGIEPPKPAITPESDIALLDLTDDAVLALKRTGVVSQVKDLTSRTEEDLLSLPAIGPTTVQRVRDALAPHYLDLKVAEA